jgi:hypothetical protein
MKSARISITSSRQAEPGPSRGFPLSLARADRTLLSAMLAIALPMRRCCKVRLEALLSIDSRIKHIFVVIPENESGAAAARDPHLAQLAVRGGTLARPGALVYSTFGVLDHMQVEIFGLSDLLMWPIDR